MVAVERFEGILEKMDKRRRQDNARSEVFPDEEHNARYRNAGGVGGDVGKRHGCPIRTLTLPSMEGSREGMCDIPKRDTTNIIAVVPARWSVSDSLDAIPNVGSMVVAGDWEGLGIGCRNDSIGSSPR